MMHVLSRSCDFMADKEAHSYSMEDVFTNVNKFLKIFKEEKIDPAVFLHSIIFTSELMIKNYHFVPKDVVDKWEAKHPDWGEVLGVEWVD